MCTYDGRPARMRAVLETQVERFRQTHPHSSARFAEVIGKRVSHVAGSVRELHLAERRVPVNDRIVMFVGDGNAISSDELERFAAQVAAALEDHTVG